MRYMGGTASKNLTIITVVTNALIIIGAGHGVGTLGMIEFFIPFSIDEYSEFTIYGNYNDRIYLVAFIGFLGQISLLISLFIRSQLRNMKGYLRLSGCILLLFSFYLMTYDFMSVRVSELSFKTGLPFQLSCLLLVFITLRTVVGYRITKEKSE